MKSKPNDFPRAASTGFMEDIPQWTQARAPYSRGPCNLVAQSQKLKKALSSQDE